MPDLSRLRACLLLLATACPAASAQDGARVDGTVVDFISRVPLGGRVVAVGNRRTVTDARGAFALEGVPRVYDLIIADGDGRAASVYLGLTRRDPLLVHWPRAKKHEWSDHAATVTGSFTGQGAFPLPEGEWINVRVLSPQASADIQLSKGGGPGYGPIDVRWDGPAEISGRLIALRQSHGAPSFWFADQPLRVRSGQRVTVDLPLRPVPVAHTTLETVLPPDHRLHVVGEYDRLAGGERVESSSLGNGHEAVSVVLTGPDLTAFGAQHCVWASVYAPPGASLRAEACGVPVNGKGTLTVTPAPALTQPRGEPLTPTTRFEWTRYAGGIHVLRFRPRWQTPDRPEITVFTAGTSAVWPDLKAVGIAFPTLETGYDSLVIGKGPFVDLDAAVGPAGLGAPSSPAQQTASTSGPFLQIKGAPNPDGGAAPQASAPRRGAPAAFNVARRQSAGDQKAAPPRGIVLGERWGCAQLASEAEAVWQCWRAPGGGQSPRAFAVPWLKGRRELDAGPDRLCQLAIPELAFRCWAPPRPGERAGHELSRTLEWTNPHHARWDSYDDKESANAAFVGGTFGCLRALPGNLWCLGDNRFGQLGNPRREATSFVEVGDTMTLGLGTWHGCAIAGRQVQCWGRGDHGQLGAPAKDACEVGGRPIPCAKTPQASPVRALMPLLQIVAGDLFTCLTEHDAIRCWGANRDGFFGTPGSCPEALRAAWPTLAGPVAAPRAGCPAEPVLIPAGVDEYQFRFSGGPRGLCFPDKIHGPWRCVGGIPSPRGEVTDVVASPGADASACALQGGQVVCWGEAYSPPGEPDRPVPITLEGPKGVTELAVTGDDDPAAWEPSCLIRQGCHTSPAPLPACTGKRARDWSEVWSQPDAFAGKTVELRGPLGVGGLMSTMKGCGGGRGARACCNGTGGEVVLGGAPQLLILEGFHCNGDESRQCCNAPAYGQTVVAGGRLERIGSGWTLKKTRLCVERQGAP